MADRWEYFVTSVDTDDGAVRVDGAWVDMNHLGIRGWELVHITHDHNPHYTAFFKRLVDPNREALVESEYQRSYNE